MELDLLETLYDRAVGGLPVLGTPDQIAADFLSRAETPEEAAEELTAYYTGLCGAAGFLFGVPGLLFLPVTLPANIAAVALLQLHMVAALAVLDGRSLEAAVTRRRVIGCLLENWDNGSKHSEEEEALTRTGIKLSERVVRLALQGAVTGAALRQMGLRRLPVVGGLLGASTDAYVTREVGRRGRELFASPAMAAAQA